MVSKSQEPFWFFLTFNNSVTFSASLRLLSVTGTQREQIRPGAQKVLAISAVLCYHTSSTILGKEVLRLPNIKSAKKRVKVIATKTMQNRAVNSQLKTQIKKANAAIENNAGDKAVVVRAAMKKIDQAAAKGIIHKNNAAHKKAALDKKLNASA